MVEYDSPGASPVEPDTDDPVEFLLQYPEYVDDLRSIYPDLSEDEIDDAITRYRDQIA